jgi:hypothetical protein
MAQQEITISRVLQELAQAYDTIINERELFERVLQRRPSQAKDPFASIREKLRWDGAQVGWVRLGGSQVVPLRVVRTGLRFRIIPSDDEYHNDQLLRYQLLPFITPYDTTIELKDVNGRPVAPPQGKGAPRDPTFIPAATPLPLGDWFRRSSFQQGDTILVTITQHEPLVLYLEREPAAAFRPDDVLRQERELIDSVVKVVERSRSNLIPAEEAILPIYARADWRTSYPGRPWKHLIENDRRLRLVDELFIASSSFRRPLDSLFENDENRDDEEAALLEQINAFQAEVLTSRRTDADQGIWDGKSSRASTARMIFDTQDGTTTVVFLDPVDALQDHHAQIEEQLTQGDYGEEGWESGIDDEESFDGFDDGDEFSSIDEIDDIQNFMAENPALAEAAQKLMAALTPDEVERLQRADSAEEAQQILAGRLQRLLPSDPSLFATFEIYDPLKRSNGDGNGYHNGHGDVVENEIDPFMLESWSDDDDDDDWEDDFSAELIPGDTVASREAIARSNDLIERFHQHLRGQGKSESTATSRIGDIWIYADFLANYYSRSLVEGDYATLDECLFFFYPRKVLNSSPRAAREICTSIKQFYIFLRAHNLANDNFAQAMWRRRDQAARVVELYEHIDSDSPRFERLFAHLFAPYTV